MCSTFYANECYTHTRVGRTSLSYSHIESYQVTVIKHIRVFKVKQTRKNGKTWPIENEVWHMIYAVLHCCMYVWCLCDWHNIHSTYWFKNISKPLAHTHTRNSALVQLELRIIVGMLNFNLAMWCSMPMVNSTYFCFPCIRFFFFF